jgi:membrane protein
VIARVKRLVRWVMRTRPYRANERLGQSRGGILSAGIAFYGVFSIFPLLVLGFTALGLVIGGNEALQDQIISYVEGLLPGVVGDTADGAIVSPETLLAQATNTTTLGVSALVGIVTLLWTGLGWISSLREGIRGVFRMPTLRLDIARAKLFDLAVLLSLGTLIVVTSLANVVTSTATEQLLDALGLERTTFGRAVTLVVVALGTLLLNTVLIAVLYRVLALASAPYRTLIGGAFVAALGVAVLQQLAALVLRNVGGDFGFLQAFVPILTLFVWLNLTARVTLYGAAWVAVGPVAPVEETAVEVAPEPEAPHAARPPVLPVRWTDRAVLGAGVVLGATALGLAQVTGSAVRAVGAGLRGLVRDD